jgi:hypothetical protein
MASDLVSRLEHTLLLDLVKRGFAAPLVSATGSDPASLRQPEQAGRIGADLDSRLRVRQCLLTANEAANIVRINVERFYPLLASGALCARKIGGRWKIEGVALADWIRG